jgi:hypothetical protein
MARIVGVTLFWEGPLEDIQPLTDREGVYLVMAGQKKPDGNWDDEKWRLLDIGQLPDTNGKLASQERREIWHRLLPPDSTLAFKYARMSPHEFDATDRRIVEDCLRHHHHPLVAVEAGDGQYGRDDVVVIANTGHHAPLTNQYTCHEPSPSTGDRCTAA